MIDIECLWNEHRQLGKIKTLLPFAKHTPNLIFMLIFVAVVVQLLSCVYLYATHGLQHTRLLFHGFSQTRILEWVANSSFM